jgi:hypothetical protein
MASSAVHRTLVKSPPELWAELSDPVSLARHLGDFGEVRIARVQAETSLEWEAEDVSGTVALEPSGWGTKVTFTAVRETPEPAAVEPEPEPEQAPSPEPRPKLFARLFRRRRKQHRALEPEPAPAEGAPDLAAELAAELALVEEAMAEQDAALLTAALDRLGAAHHRPFSRG